MFRVAAVRKFKVVTEVGEGGIVGRCDAERWVCMSVQGRQNFTVAAEFGHKHVEEGSCAWEFQMWGVDSIRGVNGWGVRSEAAQFDWKLYGHATG
jgi:hypothetical protein